MSIYEKKYQWKVGLIIMALLIIITSLLYTNQLASKLAKDEELKVRFISEAMMNMQPFLRDLKRSDPASQQALSYFMQISSKNETVPVIVTNKDDKITDFRNIGEGKDLKKDSVYFYKQKAKMAKSRPPIVIKTRYKRDDKDGKTGEYVEYVQHMYYSDSKLLYQLRIYPYIQLFIISIFLGIAYLAFSTARKAEQNQVWLGMAKETAHQLGTPISSMVAWLEILKSTDDPSGQATMVGDELGKDVKRLELIAERFSKIGSKPKLVENDVIESVERTLNYVKRRASNRVGFSFDFEQRPIPAKLNTVLFDWVLENLFKNALDAMGGEGKISVAIKENNDEILIEVADTGKGIPKSKFKTVFEPGYSTKKRGWGLGLSLSKRIVENYHSGKIFVQSSSPQKGTTFHIIIPKVA